MIFGDREEAGTLLAKALKDELGLGEEDIIFAIPRGGIPVAYAVSSELGVPMSVVVVRKLGLPWNEEAGFGAIDPDGTLYLDERALAFTKLNRRTIEEIASKELKKLEERERKFAPGGYPRVEGRRAVIVDDGAATGYTLIAGAGFIKKRGARKVFSAVPVCPEDTAARLEERTDGFVCYYSSSEPNFAVGSFYRDFHQLSDEEVLEYINRAKERGIYYEGPDDR